MLDYSLSYRLTRGALGAVADWLHAVWATAAAEPTAVVVVAGDPEQRLGAGVTLDATVPLLLAATSPEWVAAPASGSCWAAGPKLVPNSGQPLDPLESAGNCDATCPHPWLELWRMVLRRPAAHPHRCPNQSTGSPRDSLAFVSCTCK